MYFQLHQEVHTCMHLHTHMCMSQASIYVQLFIHTYLKIILLFIRFILTSLPKPASMSRNKSISVRTSFAALALLTCCRNVARVNSISSTSSVKETHNTNIFYISTCIPSLIFYYLVHQTKQVFSCLQCCNCYCIGL